jgi:hypothetical protein
MTSYKNAIKTECDKDGSEEKGKAGVEPTKPVLATN